MCSWMLRVPRQSHNFWTVVTPPPPPSTPPPPPQGPRGYSQSIVSSSFSVSFTPRIIESKSSRVINLNHLWSELVVTRWTYSISVDRKLLKIGTPEKHDQSHDPWSKEIHRGQRIKERNKTVDKTDKEKKKEIKIIENKAFLPSFHCPFVKLFSLVTISPITSNHRITPRIFSTWDQCKQCHSFRFG